MAYTAVSAWTQLDYPSQPEGTGLTIAGRLPMGMSYYALIPQNSQPQSRVISQPFVYPASTQPPPQQQQQQEPTELAVDSQSGFWHHPVSQPPYVYQPQSDPVAPLVAPSLDPNIVGQMQQHLPVHQHFVIYH